ncbi:Alg9-like mannosyltransferase family [Raphanus sativus]|uniref:Mannosyltransferase n=1 Tax=Raphanus sativus TaxID=3726 RepID=A0A6J0KSA3_RAPSA|nr:mannosyltransferase APTG1 [Raphanus sativus]KAJ4912058.1 Alg9-like mannosyltransferase family [Raphanus sativus]
MGLYSAYYKPFNFSPACVLPTMEIRKRRNADGDGDGAASANGGDGRDSSTVSSKSIRVTRSTRRIFMFCLAFRVVNALLIQTYFNPDEHWQSLEVAHRTVFGYGYMTWEWKRGIRSYLHPMLFAFLYKLLHLTALDTTPYLMSKAPRLLQSVFSALGDLYFYKLSHALYGDNVASWSFFCQLANWFMFFCMNRTFSNCLETVLTIMGLYYWPCIRDSSKDHPVNRKLGLVIAALACAVRPTSAIIWLYVGTLELFLTPNKVKFVVLEVIPIGSLVLGLTCLLDRLMYGSWVIVPLNFLKFNFLSSGGDYYGTHPWHWYFSQGFLVMLFTFTPLSVAGMIKSKNHKLSALILWVLTIYSLLGHKEFRFVLPVLPIALIFSGYALAQMEASPSSITKKKQVPRKKWSPKLTLSVLFLLLTNIPMALYMSLFHQRGTEDAMNYLSEEAYKGRVKSILFLMPCHSTPYYSTLHSNIPMQFLDCTPSEEKGQVDESDRFMMDPLGFVSELAGNWSERPSHIVMFASEEIKLRDFIIQHSFREVKRFFHAHFKVDRDLQSSVVVYANIED